MHHWVYSERDERGLYQAHLWMGATEMRFATEDDAAFRAVADARAAQKFNHLRGFIGGEGADSRYSKARTRRTSTQFRRLDERIRYLNAKGITADLILAADGAALVKAFPSWQQRRRFLRYLVGRYAAMNVTWQGVQYFEDSVDTRALLKETGAVLKELDGYQHPRTSGARVTSAPLLDDGWMDFAAYGNTDDQIGAIEHQLYGVPFVNLDCGREDSGAGKSAPGRRGHRGLPQAAVECHHERAIGDLRQHRRGRAVRQLARGQADDRLVRLLQQRHALLGTGAVFRRRRRPRPGAGRHRVRGLHGEAGAARTDGGEARLRHLLGQPDRRRSSPKANSRATTSPGRRPTSRTIGFCTWCAKAASKA